MTTVQRAIPLAILLLAGACKDAPTVGTVADSAAVAAAHAGIPAIDPDARLIASIEVAMRKHVEFKDSMLGAYRLTQAQFDSIKAIVVADSTKNATYLRLLSQ